MKLLGLILLLALTCLSWKFASSAKILVIFPMTSGSHYILGQGVARVLVEAGHDVTFISPFVEKNPPKNGTWTDVVLTGFKEEHDRKLKTMNLFENGRQMQNPLLSIAMINFFGLNLTEEVLQHENVQKLIKSDAKFDAVIIEQFNNDALKAFAVHFKAPQILVSSIGANAWVNPLVGNPSPSAYIPEIFMSYSDHMTFCERVKNTLFGIISELNRNLYFFPQQNKLVQKYFPNPPQLNDFLYNASLVLLNSHVSTNQPKPQVPAMVEIGGYHIKAPQKLPKDLQEFLDNAKDGVIYFSMGSNVQSATMPKETRDLILRVFAKLKQKILWKWEEDVLPGQPENVKTGKWLPQSDILAHPNVKLFISHGGLLSTTETIYHGKPVLSLPIMGDQMVNAAQAVNNGYALSLNFFNLNEELFENSIKELLENPKYYANAQKRSQLMHDRPLTPQQSLVYWVEYAIRHQGAPHLRVAALDLAWYQYLLLDVFAFLAVCLFTMVCGFKIAMRKICGCKKSTKKAKKD